jgi:hypothetical protein
MKKIIQILLILICAVFFLSATKTIDTVSKESIIDTKWFIKGQDSTTAIYFKHDNTFWHYRYRNLHTDSLWLCRWDLINDRIYLTSSILKFSSCAEFKEVNSKDSLITTPQSFKIIFLNDDKMTVYNPVNNKSIEYTKYQ